MAAQNITGFHATFASLNSVWIKLWSLRGLLEGSRVLKLLIWLICRSMHNLMGISQRIAESVAFFALQRATVSRFCVYGEKVSRFCRGSQKIAEEIILATSLRPNVTSTLTLYYSTIHQTTQHDTN